ncbi:MAG: GGDEF domain-containing protein [Candidatus Dormibacteria bacterium]
MKVVNGLREELSEADLAVFGVEDREDMAVQPGIISYGYDLDVLPDRDAFLDEAARHVAHARRSKHPLCFALVAFDHATDDDGANGRAAEEEFLREATARWREVLRAEDLMGRWDEDEFAIVLVNCTTVSAVQLCWRLREETPAGHSFSAGLVSFEGTEMIEDLVDRADECLAQARAKGRDRTVAEGLVDLD